MLILRLLALAASPLRLSDWRSLWIENSLKIALTNEDERHLRIACTDAGKMKLGGGVLPLVPPKVNYLKYSPSRESKTISITPQTGRQDRLFSIRHTIRPQPGNSHSDTASRPLHSINNSARGENTPSSKSNTVLWKSRNTSRKRRLRPSK